MRCAIIGAVPTSTGDPVAPPRPDRGPTPFHLSAPPPGALPAARVPLRPAVPGERTGAVPEPGPDPVVPAPAGEPGGCLFALSQPPLMLFLTVIGTLIGLGAAWDLLFV